MNKTGIAVLIAVGVFVSGIAAWMSLAAGGTMPNTQEILDLVGGLFVTVLVIVGAWKLGDRDRRSQNLTAIHLRYVLDQVAQATGLKLVSYPAYEHPIVGRMETFASRGHGR